MTKSESIARINMVLPFLDESQAEKVADFVLFLLDSDDFTETEIKSISQSRIESADDKGQDWKSIRRS